MTIPSYSIEEELKYHDKLMNRKSFHKQVKENFTELRLLARMMHLEIEISVEDYIYTFK